MDKALWDIKVNAEKLRRLLFPKEDMTSPILNWQSWIWCLRYFAFRCAYCGVKKRLYAEHFKPRLIGGELTRNNIIPACERCNWMKGNQEAVSWYKNQPFFNEKRLESILLYLLRKKDKTKNKKRL